MRHVTILLLLLLSASSYAQVLQGVVTDGISHKPLSAVTVIDVNTQQSVYTDDKGYYSISASAGDIIAFSFIGYKSVEKRKLQSAIPVTMNVSLQRMEYQLQEFLLRPGHLTKYQLDSLERAVTYRVPLQRRPPSPFMSPVSALAEKFSKRAKRTYQFQKDFAAGEMEKFIDTRYTPELVMELTKLAGDSIGHFMYAYPMEYEYARTATDLEIKAWIRNNYREWMKKQQD